MSTSRCYDCGGVLPTRDERRAGIRHAHIIPDSPVPGTTYTLETYKPDGFLGSYACDIVDAQGKTVAGVISSRSACETLLRCRGFRGPFKWHTVAQSEAARKERRALARVSRHGG